jgi:hypothetical protein
MKRALPRRVPFFVPMLTAALIVVGWGVAGAGPCMPDGQTCRTDASCCSGVFGPVFFPCPQCTVVWQGTMLRQ